MGKKLLWASCFFKKKLFLRFFFFSIVVGLQDAFEGKEKSGAKALWWQWVGSVFEDRDQDQKGKSREQERPPGTDEVACHLPQPPLSR